MTFAIIVASLLTLQLVACVSYLGHVNRGVIVGRQFDGLLRVNVVELLRHNEGQVGLAEADCEEKGLFFRQIAREICQMLDSAVPDGRILDLSGFFFVDRHPGFRSAVRRIVVRSHEVVVAVVDAPAVRVGIVARVSVVEDLADLRRAK